MRDNTADRLKDGDVTDVKIREIVVRELNDIKSKLDGLARKDVLSSYRFLKEGVDLLSVALDISNDIENDEETSSVSNAVGSGILNDALELSSAVRKLKFNSDKDFKTARKRFEDARKTATHAFCNEALSIKDKIFAAKLRVASEVLECLETPESAITGCLSFLHDLHSLPAIREIFSVYLNGGIKSRLNRAERMENVKSVMMINYVLYQFSFKFCRKRTQKAIWPMEINLVYRSFNPILNWQEISSRKSWGEEMLQPRNELLLPEKVFPYHSALNGREEIIAVSAISPVDVKVFSKTGESKSLLLPTDTKKDGRVIEHDIVGLAVDNHNNLYIVRRFEIRDKNVDVKSYVLSTLDEEYNLKHQCTLDFLQVTGYGMSVEMNNNDDIVILKHDEPYVYVCDSNGHLKYKFQRDLGRGARIKLAIIDNNDVAISSGDNIYIYAERGNLKSTITLPYGNRVTGLAFQPIICKLVVFAYNFEKDSNFLFCYSETGELETKTFFSKNILGKLRPNIVSHPGVPIAVVMERRIVYV